MKILRCRYCRIVFLLFQYEEHHGIDVKECPGCYDMVEDVTEQFIEQLKEKK